MKLCSERGLTLVELLLAITGMTIISTAATFLLTTTLDVQGLASSRSELYREGLFAMERMKKGVRNSTYLNVPNGQMLTRNYLVFSGSVNDDNDFYFGDPLFPRIDEDPFLDRNMDSDHGLTGFDDDGDGSTDEGLGNQDDDEDGLVNEDDLDGIDNDGDGNIDEDSLGHVGSGSVAGIIGIDDDNDGTIDEGLWGDDDEDGTLDEDGTNEILYWVTGNQLMESHHWDGQQFVLSTHATAFTATYDPPDATHGPRIQILLTLTGDDGESISFSEYVYIENAIQRIGKRVR